MTYPLSEDQIKALLSIMQILKDYPNLISLDILEKIIASVRQNIEVLTSLSQNSKDMIQLTNGVSQTYKSAKKVLDKSELKQIDNEVKDLQKMTNKMTETVIIEESTEDKEKVQRIYGNEELSYQTIDDKALEESSKEALENGLSIVDLTDCLGRLRELYSIREDESLTVVKSDSTNELSSDKQVEIVGIYRGKEKLDISSCEDTKISVKIPISKDSKSIDKYNEFKKQGIDIFNPNDPAFVSRCFLKQPYSDYDITIDTFRKEVFSNNSITCDAGCTYDGIDENNYIKCSCQSLNTTSVLSATFTDMILGEVTKMNIEIVTCMNRAFDVRNLIIFSGLDLASIIVFSL
jgi:hypothetical protein